MRTRALGIGCLMIGTLAVACSGQVKVSQDYDAAVSFDGLRTFAWAEPMETGEPHSKGVSSLFDQRVRRSVEDALFVKGMVKTAAREPDLLVQYYTSTEKKLRVDTNYYGYGYGGWGYGGGYTDTTVREYEVGTLLIDFIDPGKKELMWRGTGVARVQKSRTPEEREALIRAAVEKILDQFPPKKK